LTLVIPCYNEAHRFRHEAFASALTSQGWLSLCFVNDGSTDTTAEVLEAFRQAYPGRVAMLTLPHNVGKGEAVRRGLLHAADRGPANGAQLVGFWDADLATPLEECAALRAQLEGRPETEWVFGIRLRSLGRQVSRRAARHYLGRLFATAASLTLGVGAYDTQCGAKLFRVTPLLRAVLSEPFRSRWIFDVEMLMRAQELLGGRSASARHHPGDEGPLTALVYEQPLARWTHQPGSKVRPTDFLRALRDLARVRADRARWRARRISGG
jgi:glycosyltransferase involved in cell wall biosynthesis